MWKSVRLPYGGAIGLIISFDTEELRDCCCSLEVAEQKLGGVHAQSLISLIADAEASENAADLIDLFCVERNSINGISLLFVIGLGWQVEFVAAGSRFNLGKDNEVIWKSVKRLKLLNISRYI